MARSWIPQASGVTQSEQALSSRRRILVDGHAASVRTEQRPQSYGVAVVRSACELVPLSDAVVAQVLLRSMGPCHEEQDIDDGPRKYERHASGFE